MTVALISVGSGIIMAIIGAAWAGGRRLGRVEQEVKGLRDVIRLEARTALNGHVAQYHNFLLPPSR